MDVVHPSYVTQADYTSDCAWIKQVVEEHSVCLLIARVTIEGPFGVLVTEAAVSKNLPLCYPYLFSNKSDQLLKERGQCFSEEVVLALTRAKARQLATKLQFDDKGNTPNHAAPPLEQRVESDAVNDNGKGEEEKRAIECEVLPPVSRNFQALASVEKSVLAAEQKSDPSLIDLRHKVEEGLAKKNVSFHVKSGLLYRHYQDRKGKVVEQLIVPQKYRSDLLHLAHSSSWAGHLGVRKTKLRLTQDYYWPGCWKDVELFVRSCDVCQREVVGENMRSAQQKAKAYYDKSARKRSFAVGDQVMLLKPSKQNKLEVQWEGPANVVQKISETNYAVEMGNRQKKVKVYHCNLMKPYREREAVVNMTLNTPEEEHNEIPDVGTNKELTTAEIFETARVGENLEPSQLEDLKRVIEEFRPLFSEKPGKTSLVVHDIELTSEQPVRSKPYRMSPRQKDIMQVEIQKMLELGVIEPAESDFTSPMILVEVPGKDPRPCIDYRRLNSITRDETYPIPNIEERLE
ncbi:uncharacterized protein LOC135384584 [Ornithodoros turicata]|uniref:uncharacterized protein LOC135384584 n=1 Tax=Ornithodoros turicata TaxID=34597 RepID=UPI0031386860